jgi:hypothetical protein
VVLALFLTSLSTASASPPAQPASSPCASSEHHRLDFWIGDWDAYDAGAPATPSAHVRVAPILDGCALREEYHGSNGAVGESLSTYDATRGVWHQTWMTNHGALLVLEGRFEGDLLTLVGRRKAENGKTLLVRGHWQPAGKGRVHEWAETSADGGTTWTVWFDFEFRPDAARHRAISR